MNMMFRQFVAALVAACLAWAPAVEAVNKSPGGAPGLTNAGAVSITGGTVANVTLSGTTNAKVVVAKWAVPMIVATTGTMGNNGAVSGMTALPATYSNGAWLYIPAGAVAAGVPASAGWYWFVASSTTAGTVYNSTYTSGVPGLGTTTAFSTTGPGAFTGVTTQITGPQITIPANTLGANGVLSVYERFSMTNSANTKTTTFEFGASDYGAGSFTLVNAATDEIFWDIAATGATNTQMGEVKQLLGTTWGSVTTYNRSEDLTAAQTLKNRITRGTATENYVIERGEVWAVN